VDVDNPDRDAQFRLINEAVNADSDEAGHRSDLKPATHVRFRGSRR